MTPTLEQIKQNLLEVRNHTHFNIGSPQAIDHLLISLVAVIDAIESRKRPKRPKAERPHDPHPKYDPRLVERIRELCTQGRTLKSLSQEFGVPRTTVQRICSGVVKPYDHRGRKGVKRGMRYHEKE